MDRKRKLIQIEGVIEFIGEACSILEVLGDLEEDKELKLRFRSITSWLKGEKERLEEIKEDI